MFKIVSAPVRVLAQAIEAAARGVAVVVRELVGKFGGGVVGFLVAILGGALALAIALAVLALALPLVLGAVTFVLAVALVVVVPAALAAAAWYVAFRRRGRIPRLHPHELSGELRKEIKVSGPVRFRAGPHDVRIQPGSSNALEVTCRYRVEGKRAAEWRDRFSHDPPIVVEGNTVWLGDLEKYGSSGAGTWLGPEAVLQFSVRLPPGMDACVETGSGDQVIADLRGAVESRAGSGDVAIRRIAGPVTVQVGSGDVVLDEIAGNVVAQAGSGDLTIRGVEGALEATVSSGDIHATGLRGEVHLSAGSGDLYAEAACPPEGEWAFETGSGDVAVRLPADSQFRLVVETRSGEVRCSFPVRWDREGERGTVGESPTATVRVETGSGDGTIQPK